MTAGRQTKSVRGYYFLIVVNSAEEWHGIESIFVRGRGGCSFHMFPFPEKRHQGTYKDIQSSWQTSRSVCKLPVPQCLCESAIYSAPLSFLFQFLAFRHVGYHNYESVFSVPHSIRMLYRRKWPSPALAFYLRESLSYVVSTVSHFSLPSTDSLTRTLNLCSKILGMHAKEALHYVTGDLEKMTCTKREEVNGADTRMLCGVAISSFGSSKRPTQPVTIRRQMRGRRGPLSNTWSLCSWPA